MDEVGYKFIGKGGQGYVLLVEDPTTKLKYAIKIFENSGNKSDDLESELNILMNKELKKNINIVKYYSLTIKTDFSFIMMEFCEGGNLEDYLRSFGENSIPENVFLNFKKFVLFFEMYIIILII
jgi:serine/threonine protein kinase